MKLLNFVFIGSTIACKVQENNETISKAPSIYPSIYRSIYPSNSNKSPGFSFQASSKVYQSNDKECTLYCKSSQGTNKMKMKKH